MNYRSRQLVDEGPARLRPLSGPGKKFLWAWQALSGAPLVREHRFHEVRLWRFDFAHVATRIAIEIEGGTWSASRHTTPDGYRRDCWKYNEAVFLGWSVYRLTTDMIRIPILGRIHAILIGRLAAPVLAVNQPYTGAGPTTPRAGSTTP